MTTTSPEQVLKKYFGYDAFRPMQREVIVRVLENQDALVLMPTGGGKSICYQVPAMVKEGLAIVVSPLISLMKDQVEALLANKIPAAYINSSQSTEEQRLIARQCLDEKLKILYISPEKLVTERFIEFMKSLKISLFAIDEAHCVSNWGHDFRPEYTQLKFLKQAFPETPMIALTATADKVTRRDILKQLALKDPEVFIASFERKNIELTVLPALNRVKRITQFIEERPNQAGIVYCISRKSTEELAEKLKKAGINSEAYHAGMDSSDRSRVQEKFLKDDLQVICATIAFGMGIDKPNVRYVIHYNLPKNLESYYQEIGRAGRDGLDSKAMLFYSFQDVMIWRKIIDDTQDTHLRNLRLAKLERMQQFAEAGICRRRILLNYFNENYAKNCGNCDVCRSPRTTKDGTILAQKALSALIRLKEQVGITMLINVLRGSANQELMNKGYHQIKTYGVGKDIGFEDWRDYIHQMLNLGVFDMAYDENYVLKKGGLAEAILFNNYKIQLSTPQAQLLDAMKAPITKSKTELLTEELFEVLRKLRKELAEQQKVAPYVIFNDKTLDEMAKLRPINEQAFLAISGVAQAKLEAYGAAFMQEIRNFITQRAKEGDNLKGATTLLTHQLYIEGKSIEEMAEIRKISPSTIQLHLVKLYQQGEKIDLAQYLSQAEFEDIKSYFLSLDELPNGVSEAHQYFEEKYDYFQLRIALMLLKDKRNSL